MVLVGWVRVCYYYSDVAVRNYILLSADPQVKGLLGPLVGVCPGSDPEGVFNVLDCGVDQESMRSKCRCHHRASVLDRAPRGVDFVAYNRAVLASRRRHCQNRHVVVGKPGVNGLRRSLRLLDSCVVVVEVAWLGGSR